MIYEAYEEYSDYPWMEEILIDNNACEDDSKEEGFFSTMSNVDVENAFNEIRAKLEKEYSTDGGKNMPTRLIYGFNLS